MKKKTLKKIKNPVRRFANYDLKREEIVTKFLYNLSTMAELEAEGTQVFMFDILTNLNYELMSYGYTITNGDASDIIDAMNCAGYRYGATKSYYFTKVR